MAHGQQHDVVPAMAFYGLSWQAWQAVSVADRGRMQATVQHFQKIEVRSQDRGAVQALQGWRARLAWVERYVDIEHEARRAVCLMEVEPVDVLWERLRRDVARGHARVDPAAPAFRHPLHWALVELLQRSLVTLEVHDELGASGADGLTARQASQIWAAAYEAGRARVAAQVPHRVAEMLVALKPAILMESWANQVG